MESLRSIRQGEVVKAEIRRPRNLGQHRKYWAICRLVCINHDELKTERQVDHALKLLAGHVDLVKVAGQIIQVPRSISFGAADQAEFDAFFKRACDVVCQDLLPGVRLEELQEEILRAIS